MNTPELGQFIHLLLNRAENAETLEDKDRDLADVRRYLYALTTNVASANQITLVKFADKILQDLPKLELVPFTEDFDHYYYTINVKDEHFRTLTFAKFYTMHLWPAVDFFKTELLRKNVLQVCELPETPCWSLRCNVVSTPNMSVRLTDVYDLVREGHTMRMEIAAIK